MRVIFKAPNRNAPQSKLAEAEVVFETTEGELLAGLSLNGFTVWRRRDGNGLVLSVPGREYEKAGERKTWDFFRAASQSTRPRMDNLKAIILEEYERWSQEGGRQEPRQRDDEPRW